MAGLALFHDPKTESTLAIPLADVTPEAIQQRLAASRKSFGLVPEPDAFAEHGGKFVGEQPTASPAVDQQDFVSKARIEEPPHKSTYAMEVTDETGTLERECRRVLQQRCYEDCSKKVYWRGHQSAA